MKLPVPVTIQQMIDCVFQVPADLTCFSSGVNSSEMLRSFVRRFALGQFYRLGLSLHLPTIQSSIVCLASPIFLWIRLSSFGLCVVEDISELCVRTVKEKICD